MKANQRKYPATAHPGTVAYNLYDDPAGAPAIRGYKGVYATPTRESEHLAIKKALKESEYFRPAGDNQTLNWTVDDQEVAAMKQLLEANQLMEWDDFMRRWVDIRKPGMLAWMRNIDSEYVDRLMEAINRDIHLWKRLKVIDVTGPQSREDFLLLFQLAKGELVDDRPAIEGYVPGFLAPAKKPAIRAAGFTNPLGVATPTQSVGRAGDTYSSLLADINPASFAGVLKRGQATNQLRGTAATPLLGARALSFPFTL